MRNKLRVAIYCRVAHMDDDAIAVQEKSLRDYAYEQGHNDIATYADNGVSGLNLDRPALSRLETDIAAGHIGMVIVTDLSRISRNIVEAHDWAKRMGNKGVSLVSVNHGVSDSCYDNLLEAFYKNYREHRIQKRCRS